MTAASLPRRSLGRTGLAVTGLGFGGAAVGNLYRAVAEQEARASIDAAVEAGIAFFDTAPYYGFGLSEERLGAALAGRNVVISTKVGRVLEPEAAGADLAASREGFISPRPFRARFDYSYDGIMRAHEESCIRLKRDRIDILLAHDLGRETHGDAHEARFAEFLGGGYRAMRQLRESGAVGAIGLGVNEWQVCEQALHAGDFDCFLLAGRYTLLEQTALDSFLPLCAQRGVSLVIGGPFNSGILATGVRNGGGLHYNYASAPPEIVARVAMIEAQCERFGVSLAAAAIQFPLAHPQVAAVIPGLADRTEVESAISRLNAIIPDAFWQALRSEGLLHRAAPTPLSRAH